MKINKKWLLYFLFFIFIIEPKLFTQYKITTVIYAFVNIFIFIYFIIKLKNDKYRIPKILYLWIIIRAYVLLLMIINGNIKDLDQWGYLSLLVSNMIMIFNDAINKGEQYKMISAFAMVNLLYLIINFVTLIIYPNGIIPSNNLYSNGDDDIYFLGIKINYTVYIIAAVSVAGVLFEKYNKKTVPLLIVIFSIVTIFYANISTAIVCLMAFFIVFIAQKLFKIKLNLKMIVIIAILLNIAIVIFNVHLYFADFITNVLHKNVSLTGRTYIWECAIDIIREQGLLKMFFGNGIFNHGSFVLYGGDYWPSHNQWLQHIYELGILGTFLFCRFLTSCDNSIRKKGNLEYFLIAICAATMLGTITNQFFGNVPIYVPFIFLYYLQRQGTVKTENIL